MRSEFPFKVKGEGRDLKEGERRFKPLPERVIEVCCRGIQAKPMSASDNHSALYRSRTGPRPVQALRSLHARLVKPGRQR